MTTLDWITAAMALLAFFGAGDRMRQLHWRQDRWDVLACYTLSACTAVLVGMAAIQGAANWAGLLAVLLVDGWLVLTQADWAEGVPPRARQRSQSPAPHWLDSA